MAPKPPIPVPLRERWQEFRVRWVPLAVWLVALFGTWQLWNTGPRVATFQGFGRVSEVEVSSTVDGRLDELYVDLYQTVASGEPLVAIDGSLLDLQIETAAAELARLGAEVDATRSGLAAAAEGVRLAAAERHGEAVAEAAAEYPNDLRRFLTDEADLEIDQLETQVRITTALLEADRIEVRRRRAETLAAGDAGPAADVEDLELRRKVELEKASEWKRVLARQKAELEVARQRRADFEAGRQVLVPPLLADPAIEEQLAGLRAAILVQRRRIEELSHRQQSYLLRAPRPGRVAQLAAGPGQALLVGETVLVLMDPAPRQVVMWVPESESAKPALGDRFWVARALLQEDSQRIETVVEAIAPQIEALPARLWSHPQIPEYGRALLLGPVDELDLAPGEQVRIDPVVAP